MVFEYVDGTPVVDAKWETQKESSDFYTVPSYVSLNKNNLLTYSRSDQRFPFVCEYSGKNILSVLVPK